MIKQTSIDPDVISTVVEQHMAAGSDFDGAAPSGVAAFVPFWDDADGVFHWGEPDESSFEGTTGGLFDLAHKQPVVLEQIFANFGTSVTYHVYIVTSAGDVEIKTGSGQYLAYGSGELRWRLLKGEKVKITTTGGSAAMWARIYTRSEQAISV